MPTPPDVIRSAPLWPHGEISLMHLVRRAGQHSSVCWAHCVDTGLSAVQYAILVVLAEETTCDQQTLGHRAGFDKATGTYVIDRMTKSGLLHVEVDPENRRRKRVSMTPDGMAMMAQMVEQARNAEKMITAALSEQDSADLKRLLSKLTGVQPPDEPGAPGR